MEGQEVKPADSVVLRQPVQLRPRVVVDVDILLLCHGEHELVVQVPVGKGGGGGSATPMVGGAGHPLDIPDCLLDMELAAKLFGGPVKGGEVTPASSNQQEPVGSGQSSWVGQGWGRGWSTLSTHLPFLE